MSQTATIEQTTTDNGGPAIELGHLDPKQQETHSGGHVLDGSSNGNHVLGADSDEAPENAQKEAERWNYPRNNVPRLAFVFISFIVMGMNDAAIGVGIVLSLVCEEWLANEMFASDSLLSHRYVQSLVCLVSVLATNTPAARGVLRDQLHRRLAHLPHPFRWVFRGRIHQLSLSPCFWPPGHRPRGTLVSYDHLRRPRLASSLPRTCCLEHCQRFW